MECAIKISTMNVHLVDDESKLKAVVSVVLMGCFAVHGIKVIDGSNGLFVAMPNRRNKNGSFSDIAHPINRECRKHFSDTIMKAYCEARDAEASEACADKVTKGIEVAAPEISFVAEAIKR